MAKRNVSSGVLFTGSAANGQQTQFSQNTQGEEIRELIEVLWEGRWVLVTSLLVVVALAAAFTFWQDPQYEAVSTVYIDTEKAQSAALEMEQMLTLGMGSSRSLYNEVEFLKSRAVALRVARRVMNQQTLPATGKPFELLQALKEQNQPVTAADLIEQLQEQVVVQEVSPDVDIIRVRAVSTDPAEAAVLANYYVEEYLERNQEKSREELAMSRTFLEEQKAQYRRELEQIEQKLKAFKSEEQVVALDERARTLVEQMASLRSLRDKTQVESEMAQATLESLRKKANEIRPGVAKRISSGLEQGIESLQREKANLETQRELIYAKNPELRTANRTNQKLQEISHQITLLQTQIDKRAQRYVEQVMSSGGVDPSSALKRKRSSISSTLAYLTELQRKITEKSIEVSGYRARLSSLQRRVQEYKQQFRQIPSDEIQLAQLERARMANEQIYTFLVERLQEVRVAEQSELGYAEVVDKAAAPDPEEPVSPSLPLNFSLGALLGLVLGTGVVFGRHALDTRVRSPEDLREAAHKVVGVVPEMEDVMPKNISKGSVNGTTNRFDASLIAYHNPFVPAVEAYRQIRTNICFSHPDRELQALLVSSSEPGEGKTTTASNLAVAFAQSGARTLLVDADLRRPRLHKLFGLNRQPGLVEVVFKSYQYGLSDFTCGVDNLFVMPAGGVVANPAELLASERMEELVSQFKTAFDYVIFDSAPLLAASDSLALSTRCDACLLLAAAGTTDRKALHQSAQMLEQVESHLMGTVLNRFDSQTLFNTYYGYGGYGRYNGYHSAAHMSNLPSPTTS